MFLEPGFRTRTTYSSGESNIQSWSNWTSLKSSPHRSKHTYSTASFPLNRIRETIYALAPSQRPTSNLGFKSLASSSLLSSCS